MKFLQGYTTEQRKRLLSFFTKHLDNHFTVDALIKNIDGISPSAIYRNVNQMVDDGQLRRFQKEGQRKFLYQYIGDGECSEHIHLKCNKCDRILHITPELSAAFMSSVKNDYNFELDKSATILFGACSSCV